MIRLFALILGLFLALPGHSETVSVRLNEVRLPELVRLVYSDVLKRSFVFDQDFAKSPDVVSLDLVRVTPQQVEQQARLVVDARGFQVQDVGGVLFFSKKLEGQEAQETFIYRPIYRSVQYLQDLAAPLFPRESFANQRQIRADTAPPVAAVSAAAETGTNATSFIDSRAKDTLVFRGSLADVHRLQRLVLELDKPAGEVLVKAVVYEVRNDSSESNAVNLALGLIESVKGIGVTIEAGPAVQGNAVKIQAGNINAVWSALSGDSRFKLVSAPTVRIKSGSKARFMAGQEVPTLGAVSYQGNQAQAVQSVDYKPSGVILELSPEIRGAATDLTINQQISSFTATTTGVNDSPTLLKRELQTSVTVGGDEVIILGGLDETTDTESEEGLSFLPAFFRGEKSRQQRNEIMLMLHVQRI